MGDEIVEILLVEDSPEDVEFFTYTFKKAAPLVRLHVAADGAEALDFLLGTGRYAAGPSARNLKVVFLDLKLPKVDGVEVLRQLRAQSRLAHLPVVVLSSSQEERDLLQCYRLGANSYVVKPMDFEQHQKSIRGLLTYWLEYNQIPNR